LVLPLDTSALPVQVLGVEEDLTLVQLEKEDWSGAEIANARTLITD
jgi:hypothetical protein